MVLADLIASLHIDLADPDSELFTEDELTRCILKGAAMLARDLGQELAVEKEEIFPPLESETRELLLLRSGIHACQIMRMKTANVFSFSSGDKRVDQTKQPEQWAKLESDLESQYSARVAHFLSDPRGIRPVIFEQGGDL